MIDSVDIENLRSLHCESVAMRLGFVVKQHKSLCCFHDDHEPSMTYKGSHFRCWSCGAHGDTLDLVMRYLKKNFLDACRWLADEHNVILTEYKPKEEKPAKPFDASRYERFFERPWLSAEARRFLFEERRLDPRVVRWCRLTSWKDRQGTPWLQTPYYDREGRLVGVQNRNLIKGATPRFRFPSGSQCHLYGLPILSLLKPGEALYITEGCSDCWSMLSAGHKAIAIPSATLLNKQDVKLLESLSMKLDTKFHIWPDNDEPGEGLYIQLMQVLPNLERHQLPPGYKDFSEYYMSCL